MTQKEFEKHMKVLEDKRTAIQRKMQNMQDEYIANYPIQPDDKCVDRKGKICWVKELLFWTDLSTRLIIVGITLTKMVHVLSVVVIFMMAILPS